MIKIMQVSIYLKDALIKTIDRQAKKNKSSRSRFIQRILERVLLNKKEKSLFDEVAGILDDDTANAWLKTIYSSRKNSSRFQ